MPPKSCSLFPPVPVICLGESTSLLYPISYFDMFGHRITWSTITLERIKLTFLSLLFPLLCLFLFVFCLSIHSARILNTPNSASTTFPQPYQRQLPSLAPTPAPPLAHPMATIPHQPSYRAPTDRIFYMAHTCQPACLNRVRPAKPDVHRGKNPLLTPLLYDFRRMTGRRKVNRKVYSRGRREIMLFIPNHKIDIFHFLVTFLHLSYRPSDDVPRDLQGSMWALPA